MPVKYLRAFYFFKIFKTPNTIIPPITAVIICGQDIIAAILGANALLINKDTTTLDVKNRNKAFNPAPAINPTP